jgi:hypothetical protein
MNSGYGIRFIDNELPLLLIVGQGHWQAEPEKKAQQNI